MSDVICPVCNLPGDEKNMVGVNGTLVHVTPCFTIKLCDIKERLTPLRKALRRS